MKIKIMIMVLPFFWNMTQGFAQTFDTSKIYKLTLNDMLQTKSSLASGIKETALDAPASMVVLTAEDIRQRGYTSLDEVLSDLPDFDIIPLSGGLSYVNAYQRGYRTVNTQRTLFMIDGLVVNDLWSHIAAIGPQFPLSIIDRIEILSGPASAVYGANAFLGILNIVTKKGNSYSGSVKTANLLTRGKNKKAAGNINFIGGSFQTGTLDANVRGNIAGVSYTVSGRVYRAEAEDVSNRWHFLSNKLFSDKNIWGPLLDFKTRGRQLGGYYTLNEEFSCLANIDYKGFEAGIIKWQKNNGYGNEYVADRAQNNASWNTGASQYYLRHNLNSGNINNHITLSYRNSRIWGDWAEAEPDWNPGMERFSFVSYTNWNSVSNSLLLKDNFNIKLNHQVQLLAGIKYERKHLTKNYDVPGYWSGAYGSVTLEDPDGPYGHGSGITHSSDPSFIISPTADKNTPDSNRIMTHDIGGYLLGVFDVGRFRFNAGLRYDRNSIYGQVFTPRVSLIFKPNNKSAIKLIYGEAFQEPQPRALWGGWNGRKTNENLKPEKVRNLELNLLYKKGNFLQEIVAYYAIYDNVIKEEAENAGKREVIGTGYKLSYSFPNFIVGSAAIKGYLYYTFTQSISHIVYNHQTGEWTEGKATLGDIAPHKLNAGVHVPIRKFALNLRTNMVSERELYLRNPLREKDRKLAPFITFSGNISYNFNFLRLSFKVNNIFNHHYMVPGVRSANSGDDFTQRSQGYYNSLIPAPGRSFMASVGLKF